MSEHTHADQRFRDDTNLLRLAEHLRNALDDASEVRSGEELEMNRQLFNSVSMEMMQVQESARRLSESFRFEHPELPWNELRALRNVIVHEYDEVEAEALYESATCDARILLDKLQPYVDALRD